MKILILGSRGFIGQYLINFYLSKEYDVFGCDLTDFKSLKYTYFKVSLLSNDINVIFENQTFDICINASGSGDVGYSVRQPLSDFNSNVVTVVNILESIRRLSPNCKYVHISSAAVYGNPKKLPIKEESETKPLSPYGWHKLISETICQEYFSLYGLKIAIIRPFSVYGPGLKKQIFWDLFVKISKSEPKVELWGNGQESRDFIYIDDLVSLIHFVIKKGSFETDIYNAAAGIESTVSYIAQLLLNTLENKSKIYFNNNFKIGDPLNWCADISKVKKIGFENQFSVEDGVLLVAKWLKTQH